MSLIIAFTLLQCKKDKVPTGSESTFSTLTISGLVGGKEYSKMQVTITEDVIFGKVLAAKEFVVNANTGKTDSTISVKPCKIVLALNYIDATGAIVYSSDFCASIYQDSLKMQLKPGNNTMSPRVCAKGQDQNPINQNVINQTTQTRPPVFQSETEKPEVWKSYSTGYATRYWDCCKPHCGWPTNVTGNPVRTCDINNASNGDNFMAQNGCDGGNGFTCYNMAPWAVNNKLAYGFASVPASGNVCGKCYELRFTGDGRDGKDAGSMRLADKRMIVQGTNIGWDVGGGQFDILTPGGGVGRFNACSRQWQIDASALGEQYGGILTTCRKNLGWEAPIESYKDCVRNSCTTLFNKPGRSEMLQGCLWFVDWFEAADNPVLHYNEVKCPIELIETSNIGA